MKITLKCGITKKIKNPRSCNIPALNRTRARDNIGSHIDNAAKIDKYLDELDNLIEGSCGVSDWSVYADINVRTNRED